MTVVVGLTGTGVRPGLGTRLRSLAVRLAVGAGLAALGWLCAAVLGTATASADTAPPPAAGPLGLLDTAVDSVTGTVQNTLDTAVDHTVPAVTHTTENVVQQVVHHVAHPVHPAPSSRSATAAVRHAVVPKARQVAATRPVPAVHHHHAVPAPTHGVSRAPQPRSLAVRPAQRPHAPLRAPPPRAPKAPQAPSPVLPAGSINSAHVAGGAVRPAPVPQVTASPGPSVAGGTGWTADPAVLAARAQGLPVTSPD